MRLIHFKSTPENWRKEYFGLKPNTLREFKDTTDIRLDILNCYIKNKLTELMIEIENTDTHEIFTRKVTDITEWHGFFIISWEHKL